MTIQLTMLGTGNAAATHCYNTCFAIRNGDDYCLIDGGGGNGLLTQLEKSGIDFADIHEVFVTHTHTDHILGVVWLIRMIAQQLRKGEYQGELKVYGHDKVIEALQWMCQNLLPGKIAARIGNGIQLIEIKDGDIFHMAGMVVKCFDIHSRKCKQYGCKITLPDNRYLTCLGDEPFNSLNEEVVQGSDWLLHEAFCLYADREHFKPYEKSHSTALDAGRLAQQLEVANLLLFHTEDETLINRKETYTAEAKAHFKGAVWVPDDLERIDL